MKTVSVVVPVYYNAESLALLLEEFLMVEKQLREKELNLELIFVDDGSGDHSFAEMLKIKDQRPQTRLVKLARNFGAVKASKTGLRFVTGDCFMWIAADLQDPPAIILELVDHWLNGAKFVIARRAEREDPFVSKIFSGIYYWLLRRLVVAQYPEGGFDLALLDSVALPHMRDSSKNVNTPLLAYWLGFKPVVLSYQRRKRRFGRSRWTFTKRLGFLLDSLLGFSVVPIRLISLLGFIVALLSSCYGTSVIIAALMGVRDVEGFPTLVALITFLLGLIIIMLGVIGEYLWRIFEEVNKRPDVVIDEIH
ncbi:MAG: glycosyltransferase family 2 protein [Chloroflexota bacterium]|nr:glycosyltransferase family 2 protein [Chloroflexota bacterium]